jgi:hypothetical protein
LNFFVPRHPRTCLTEVKDSYLKQNFYTSPFWFALFNESFMTALTNVVS